MKKIVIILSGGMDSGVLLKKLCDSKGAHDEIHALTFLYGSNHNQKELYCAVELAKRYAYKHHIIKLPFIKDLFKSSLLEGADAVPEGHYEEESMKSTVVPFRNGIMLAIACGYAESIGSKLVFAGVHSGDHAIYPDCRPIFIKDFSQAMSNGTYNGVSILAPFTHMTKRQIAEEGNSVLFDFSMTWTCYKGLDKHCGKCGACVERKEALEGFDPTEYME